MSADDVPERRAFSASAVLEWRVTQLEAGQERLGRQMVDNKNEILSNLEKLNLTITSRLEDINSKSGATLNRVFLAVAALGTLISIVNGVIHHP
jgi:uncharacterized protein YoxC